MLLGDHAGFIVGAYGFAAVVIGGLIAGAFLDRRAQARALRDLQGDEAGRP